MTRFISLLLVFFFTFFSLTQKSEALVGIVIKSRTTKTIGGVITAVSGVTAFTTIVVANSAGTFLSYSAALGLMIFSIPGVAIGLVVLDEKNGDLHFSELDPEKASLLTVSSDELNIYNSEVEELNVIKEEIESRVTNELTDAEVGALWIDFGKGLSPETMKVAAQIIKKTFDVKVK
jgi:hypothetical protein